MRTKKIKAHEIPVADVRGKPSGKCVWHMSDEAGVFLVCPYKASQLPCGNWCIYFTHHEGHAYCKDYKLGEVVEIVKFKEVASTPNGKQGKIIRPN